MSSSCKPIRIPLTQLKPSWVQFTPTKGVLRVMRVGESKTHAQGLIFKCPRCAHDKQKDHYCIFLFDMSSVPEKARPQGRFLPTLTFSIKDEASVPEDFHNLTLHSNAPIYRDQLKPGDLKCRWEGTVYRGEVSWHPNFWERSFWK